MWPTDMVYYTYYSLTKSLFCLQLYQEGLVQSTKDGSTRDELNRRACDAERLRDEALIKLDAIQNDMRRADIA